MKIYVALFITALSTTATSRHGVLPVVSAAGDDGAAAAVDRPHLRALLQTDTSAQITGCYAPQEGTSCDFFHCDACDQGQKNCKVKGNHVACCNGGGSSCYDPDGVLNGAAQEDSMIFEADEEEEVHQDTVKLDESSPLRASLLKVD